MVLELTRPISHEGRTWYHFPDAKSISRKGSEGLKQFGFGYKTDYIHGVASLVADGKLDLDGLAVDLGHFTEGLLPTATTEHHLVAFRDQIVFFYSSGYFIEHQRFLQPALFIKTRMDYNSFVF